MYVSRKKPDAHDIRRFGWDVKESGVVTPTVSNAPVAPHGLIDVVSWQL